MSKNLFYRKFLLNRVSATKDVIDYLENLLARDEESLNHSFHKVMVSVFINLTKLLCPAIYRLKMSVMCIIS